jgi:CO/xanthine dehydrogenase FAD-binding subunit
MLIRVNTVHQPNTLDEARELINQQVRPLYGGVALHRESPGDVTAVVNLSNLGLDTHQIEGNTIELGSMLTLDDARQICLELDRPNTRFLAEMIRQEAPITLRNTMTLGDVLVERKANSVLLTALVALDATIQMIEDSVAISDWLAADDVRPVLITSVGVPPGTNQARHSYQKVSRTPADDPIVGAVAYAENGTVRVAMCGVEEHPILLNELSNVQQTSEITRALEQLDLDPPGDHWGSSEYRLAMAKIMGRRVLERAINGG